MYDLYDDTLVAYLAKVTAEEMERYPEEDPTWEPPVRTESETPDPEIPF